MKRTEALRPLSREHLRALLAARRLRMAANRDEAIEVFDDFWRDEGSRHFRIEEEILLPTWAAHAEIDHPGTMRLLEEHLAIRRDGLRLVAGLLTLDQARELGTLLHDHVRFEERQLFPKIEDSLDPESLAKLAEAIDLAEASS